MENWNDDQQKFIAKLEETGKIFEEILTKDKDGMVIPFGEERDKLTHLKKRNEEILRKLKSREFTVAVVGLEKAGKSTLGNALLKRNILPEYTARCTFTTTKICAGNEDKGEIFFYSAEEFKRDFADTLKNVLKYEQPASFDTMDADALKRWWDTMEEKDNDTYSKYNTTTFRDVYNMLNGKNILNQLLGQKKLTFYGSDLETTEFKKFITGIDGYDSNHAVIRSAHPYAVKNVIIESANLGAMKDIVLYDVPGFNSPTELHKKQTLDMLRAADAIILVTNVGKTPNLDSSQLGMLRKGKDEENIPLSDKAFVFGNQIDIAQTAASARDNIAELKKDSLDNRIAKIEHIFIGSAKAYLENEGIESSNEALKGSTASKDKMDEWQMAYGITELWKSMQEYYNNDRFEVLKRRAEKTVSEAKDFLDGILKKYESSEWQPVETGGEFYLKTLRTLRKFKESAYDIAQEYNEKIVAEQPFSNMISENINEIFPNQDENSELLLKITRGGNIYTNSQIAITRIDADFREELQRIFLKNIVEKTAKATEDKEKEIYDKIKENFLEVMGMPADSPYKAELLESLDELFTALWIKNADKCRFNSLVERFTSDLLEALIMTPFSSAERFQKLSGKSFPEFISLATYYEHSPNAPQNDDEDRFLEFFSKILLHTNSDADNENKDTLKKFFSDNKDAITNGLTIAADFLPLGKWAKLILRGGIKLNEMPANLKSKLQSIFYNADWANLSKDDRVKKLEKIFSSYVAENSKISGKLTVEKLEYLHKLSKVTEIKNENEMLDVLNEDIEILRKFTLDAVIYAMGLEQAFISVITKNINIVRREDETDEGAEIFDKWIIENIRKLKVQEFAELERRNTDNQARKNIVETVRKVVDKLDD